VEKGGAVGRAKRRSRRWAQRVAGEKEGDKGEEGADFFAWWWNYGGGKGRKKGGGTREASESGIHVRRKKEGGSDEVGIEEGNFEPCGCG